MGCRICGSRSGVSFCDLGASPLSNAYITAQELTAGAERVYPLHAYVCETCKLVQLDAMETPDRIFSQYAYFSSYSSSWVEHARTYAVAMVERLDLRRPGTLVMEIASNDGYLLQHFVERGIRAIGVEPAENVAAAARAKGVPTEVAFFGRRTATELVAKHGRARLVAGNNVLAHVPDLHDFIAGVKIALAPDGTGTFEFPHLLRLIAQTQFDTIYHEHFSYFALRPLRRAFSDHGLAIVDVDELATHGGSLRIYVAHAGHVRAQRSVGALLGRERAAGLDDTRTYARFQSCVDERRGELLAFLDGARNEGTVVAGYGAPAKGNTLLNYCRVDQRLLPFTVDRNPHKQSRLLPGSHIPIFSPQEIFKRRPGVLLILPWNLKPEVEREMCGIAQWGGRFAVAIPRLRLSA